MLIDNNQQLLLSKATRRLLALMEVQNDKSLLQTLTKQSQEELRKKLKETEKEMPFKILTAYRYLAVLEEGGMNWKDLGIPTTGSDQSISERVKQYLKDHEKLLTKLTPKYLLDKTFGKDENEKSLRDIYELSMKTPGMPLLESESVLLDAVAEGVRTGIFGVKESEELYYRRNISPDIDSIVLRGEVAKRIKEESKEIFQFDDHLRCAEGDKAKIIEKKKEGLVRKVSLRAIIPWDKLSSVITGVIRPLKDRGSPPEIIIEIRANSDEGFDRTTLDSKVKETLQQIDAKIESWKED